MVKRTFDFCCAIGGLIVLSPILLLAALSVKLSSPGPIFFRQVRIGRSGVPFRIFKLRTMSGDEPTSGPILTIGADPRITRIGHFLRTSKIDELPQLINVVIGDMSLVGPRPEVPKYVDKWTPAQREIILSVRPGVTGPASLQFRNQTELLAKYDDPEAAYETVITQEKLKLCEDYIRTGTLWTDIRLILQTVISLFR